MKENSICFLRSMKSVLIAAIMIFILIWSAGCGSQTGAATATPAQSPTAAATEEASTAENTAGQETQATEASNSKELLSPIMNSFSGKEFTAEEVSSDDIQTILAAGAKASSARNGQPWHFTVVTKDELNSEMVSFASEGSVVIAISGVTKAQEGINVDFDCALATQNMYIAAHALGLGPRILTGPVQNVNNSYREALAIPDGYEVIALLCVGHVENYTEEISSASLRNPLEEIVNYIE